MLIFTKKIGETFVTDSYATITVLDLKKDQVKLGINSPIDVAVRHEIINQYIKTGLGEIKKVFLTLLDDPRKTEDDGDL